MSCVSLNKKDKKGIHDPLSNLAAVHPCNSPAWRSRERKVTSSLLLLEGPATHVPGCVMQPCSQRLSQKVAWEYPGDRRGMMFLSVLLSKTSCKQSAEPQGKKPGFSLLECSPEALRRNAMLGKKECTLWMTATFWVAMICLASLTVTTMSFPCQQNVKWTLTFIVF